VRAIETMGATFVLDPKVEDINASSELVARCCISAIGAQIGKPSTFPRHARAW
jgi:hypothetical protein